MYLHTIFINNKYSHKWIADSNQLLTGTYLIIHEFLRNNGWEAMCRQKDKEYHNAYTIDAANSLSQITIEITCEQIAHFNVAKFYQDTTEYYSDGNYRRLLNMFYNLLSDQNILPDSKERRIANLQVVYTELQLQ